MKYQNLIFKPFIFNSVCGWAYKHPTYNHIPISHQQEKIWGNNITNQIDNNQWTTKLGENLVYNCLYRLGENPHRPNKINNYKPDWETDNYIYEVKTRSWTTKGTAGEKVYGTPLKYAEIPKLYNKPLRIVCVANQEYELTYGNTPIFGNDIRTSQLMFLEFYKYYNIEFIPCTQLIQNLKYNDLF
jgi:hypothetical protein